MLLLNFDDGVILISKVRNISTTFLDFKFWFYNVLASKFLSSWMK